MTILSPEGRDVNPGERSFALRAEYAREREAALRAERWQGVLGPRGGPDGRRAAARVRGLPSGFSAC